MTDAPDPANPEELSAEAENEQMGVRLAKRARLLDGGEAYPVSVPVTTTIVASSEPFFLFLALASADCTFVAVAASCAWAALIPTVPTSAIVAAALSNTIFEKRKSSPLFCTRKYIFFPPVTLVTWRSSSFRESGCDDTSGPELSLRVWLKAFYSAVLFCGRKPKALACR